RNTGILHSINPEIDRTYHSLVRQNRTLDTNFVSVSEHPVAENTAYEHSVFVHSEYSDSVYSVAFPNFDHSVHSENMAQPPTPPGPRERTLRELAAPDFTYDSLCIQYEDVPYVLKTRLIHLLSKFNGLAGQDPHKHLKFLNIDIDIDIPCTSLYTCHSCTDSELCDSCIDEFLNIVVDSPVTHSHCTNTIDAGISQQSDLFVQVQATTKPSFATFFPSVLQAPDWTPPFDLECDIVVYALGTVLASYEFDFLPP
ncbi:hypothetical protein Lal_00030131, partial [Lupinus albus]